ncbi:hypothetical protein DPMN_008571 [Dreissena polymorpha]|uniref:Uncharacterized protein n=1 Tax=Dreissena polymorpha TaxID=45954 RepID=A0A9D4MYB8_DREPO|nr:hypothetical protein DPMN_008571 [Dreissena polymorpha]
MRNRYYMYAMKFRERQKLKSHIDITIISDTEQSPCISANSVTSSTVIQESRSSRSSNSQLLVRMAFPGKQRANKALVKARNEIQSLKKSIHDHQKSVAKWKKKYQLSKKQAG